MSIGAPSSDTELLELLRASGSLGVPELAAKMEVTPTAVRQRLARLMAQGLIQRETVRKGRGRPSHRYSLTRKGLRISSTNLADLAYALWSQMNQIEDPHLKKALVERVAQTLAAGYATEVVGLSPQERMEEVAELLRQRGVPCNIDSGPSVPNSPQLAIYACPYPELADQDPQICALEERLFSKLIGQQVHPTECRRQGGRCCRFQPA